MVAILEEKNSNDKGLSMEKKYRLKPNTGPKRPVTLSLYEAAELFDITPLSLACMLRDDKNAPAFFEVRKSQKSHNTTTGHLRYYAKHEIIEWWRKRHDIRTTD